MVGTNDWQAENDALPPLAHAKPNRQRIFCSMKRLDRSHAMLGFAAILFTTSLVLLAGYSKKKVAPLHRTPHTQKAMITLQDLEDMFANMAARPPAIAHR